MADSLVIALRDFANNLSIVLSFRKFRVAGIIATIIYEIIFLITIGDVVISPNLRIGGGLEPPALVLSENWAENIWRPRAPLYYESIAALYLASGVAVFISIPNILMGAAIAILVGLNVSVAYYSFTARACRIGAEGMRNKGSFLVLANSTPSFFAGMTCCAPTIAIILGANIAVNVALITLRAFLIPISVLALLLGLLWSSIRVGRLTRLHQ